MESDKIYENSLAELKSIENKFAYDSLTINLSKLDRQTKQEIINALSVVISRRKNAVIDVLQGAK